MYRGHRPDEMAQMRSLRAPSTDVRDGKIHHQIRSAFIALHSRQPIRTKDLLEWTYGTLRHSDPLRPWMRTHVIAQARKVAIPTRIRGSGAGRGCGFVWVPIPEKLEERSPQGKWKRRQARKAGL